MFGNWRFIVGGETGGEEVGGGRRRREAGGGVINPYLQFITPST